MKREIKFRAWVKTEGLQKMYFGVSFIPYGEGWSGGNPDYKYYQIFHGQGSFFLTDFSAIELMQYTGLKDRNGKEIYEGDIVKCGYGYGEVIFNAGCFMVQWIDDKEAQMEFIFSRDGRYSRRHPDDFFQIIGNIYETLTVNL
jgi:uncharacterized phage protein (TIGR01671 family)